MFTEKITNILFIFPAFRGPWLPFTKIADPETLTHSRLKTHII